MKRVKTPERKKQWIERSGSWESGVGLLVGWGQEVMCLQLGEALIYGSSLPFPCHFPPSWRHVDARLGAQINWLGLVRFAAVAGQKGLCTGWNDRG